MDNQSPLQVLDFRKKIKNKFHLTQIDILAKHWAVSPTEVCWRLITDGICNEKKKREEIEVIKKQNGNA